MNDAPVVPEGDVTPPEGDVTPPEGDVTPPAEPAIPVSALPEDLQGVPVEQVPAYISAMVDGTMTGANRIRDLEEQVRRLEERGIPAHAAPTPPVDLPPLEERIIDSPRDAILQVVREEFGPLIDEIRGDSTTGSREALFAKAARDNPDFASHENEVRQILERQKGRVTEADVHGAYLMAEGIASVRAKQKAAAAAAAEPPSPPASPTPKSDIPQLTRDIAANMGVSEEELPALMAEGPLEVEVPTN